MHDLQNLESYKKYNKNSACHMNPYSTKKQTLREKKEMVRKVMVSTTFRAVLAVMVVVFGFMYVWQTNTVSTKGYVISDLERQIQDLEHETRRLEVDIAKHTSMRSIQERLSEVDLVAASNVEYVSVMGTAVAKR